MTGATRTEPDTAIPVTGLLLLTTLTLVWGLNWPVMKIILSEMTVWWFRAICLIFGGLGLLVLAAATRAPIVPSRQDVAPLLLTSVFAVGGWHMCSAFGISLMPAGRAVILAFTMPVWAAVAAAVFLGERISVSTVAGLLLGVAGIGVLIGPDLIVFQSAPVGALFMLSAAVSWAIGTVLFKRFAWTIPVITNMGWQLLAASIPVTAMASIYEPVPDLASLSLPAIVCLAYVLLLPMTFGQWAYFSVVRLFPASLAAMGTLAIPIVGVYSSAWMLGETISTRDLAALALICAALVAVLLLPRWLQRHAA